ncbi:uncharacterized protein LOC105645352 [Jatropha curcas]|uniref:uncharacterized protein LOC105645352 n=1 Tax=Jatropha curcas TaxID=180498 RepID=UPI0018945568|nr:uncharacterized protein LOC105645352 [Jatropha curcas]XP_037496435.1 uncharacterized protein LOC105645352 [Jatropha curcas]
MASYPIKVVSTVTLQSSADKLVKFLGGASTDLKNLLPDVYTQINVRESTNDYIKRFQLVYASGFPIVWAEVNITVLDRVNMISIYHVHILTNGNAGDFNTRGTTIRVIEVLRADGNGSKVERTYEFERANTDVGPAFFEFEISNLIKLDKKLA